MPKIVRPALNMCSDYSQNTIGLLLYNRTDVTVVKVNSNGHFLLDMIGHDKKRTSATKDKLG